MIIKGYAALARAVVVSTAHSGVVVGRCAALLLLGLTGAALTTWARSAHTDTKVLNSAFLLSMFAAPMVLRAMGGAASYRHLLVGATVVGLMVRLPVGMFAVTLTPIIVLLRRWVRPRASLALTSAALSPMTICPSAYLDGGSIGDCLYTLRSAPGTFVVAGLPWIAGALLLGWMLGARTSPHPQGETTPDRRDP
jgi:hypothetical protein